ncbi:hypothetical protein C9F11_44095 (plasmid) [Streptomyces sp. YIM 121038]|uniref:DUF6192 family protein n=1 Tax=Streptomyces sp. YIM 121038 TaxID=2136401 RepID=UPI001110616D|nr:hypothetical protein C9F11_44095 [Streptomyces sp. YIM 121038]
MGDAEFSVRRSLTELAEDIGLKFSTVRNARWAVSRWPEEHRQSGVSFTVHRILGGIEDEEERFTAIRTPPAGKSRWTPDDASRRMGRQVETPVSPQEKISAIHSLAQDDEVAAQVTGDLLRRPKVATKFPAEEKARVVEEFTRDESIAAQAATNLLRRPDVAFKAMSDDGARQQVNHAQVERGRQARAEFEQTHELAPVVKHFERTAEFLDLITACHAFVAKAGRTVPGLCDRRLGAVERDLVHERIAKVRGVLTELRPEFPQVSDLLRGLALADA